MACGGWGTGKGLRKSGCRASEYCYSTNGVAKGENPANWDLALARIEKEQSLGLETLLGPEICYLFSDLLYIVYPIGHSYDKQNMLYSLLWKNFSG